MVAAAGWPDKPPRMWLGSTAPSIHGGASKCADHSMRFGCVLQGVLRLERILGDAFLPEWPLLDLQPAQSRQVKPGWKVL